MSTQSTDSAAPATAMSRYKEHCKTVCKWCAEGRRVFRESELSIHEPKLYHVLEKKKEYCTAPLPLDLAEQLAERVEQLERENAELVEALQKIHGKLNLLLNEGRDTFSIEDDFLIQGTLARPGRDTFSIEDDFLIQAALARAEARKDGE